MAQDAGNCGIACINVSVIRNVFEGDLCVGKYALVNGYERMNEIIKNIDLFSLKPSEPICISRNKRYGVTCGGGSSRGETGGAQG